MLSCAVPSSRPRSMSEKCPEAQFQACFGFSLCFPTQILIRTLRSTLNAAVGAVLVKVERRIPIRAKKKKKKNRNILHLFINPPFLMSAFARMCSADQFFNYDTNNHTCLPNIFIMGFIMCLFVCWSRDARGDPRAAAPPVRRRRVRVPEALRVPAPQRAALHLPVPARRARAPARACAAREPRVRPPPVASTSHVRGLGFSNWPLYQKPLPLQPTCTSVQVRFTCSVLRVRT